MSENSNVRRLATAALLVGLVELALAVIAAYVAVARSGAFCPAGGAFSCEAIFRPKLASLAGIPIVRLAFVGAVASAGAAAMLLRKTPNPGFARMTAFGGLAGAALALGVQPLAWIGAGAVCPICLGLVIASVVYAALTTTIARRLGRDVTLSAVVTVMVLGFVGVHASTEGRRIRAEDELALALVQRDEFGGEWREPSLILYERKGCAYCRALKIDVLANPVFRAARDAAHVNIVLLDVGERADVKVPTLVLVAQGEDRARVEGYFTDLAPYLELLEKAKKPPR